MPKVTEQHREERRAQILDAALRCFARSGFRATTMADIIGEAGLSAGAIYSYFPGKQELALAAVRHVLADRLGDIVAASVDGPIGPGAVFRVINAGLDRSGIDPAIIVQMWGEAVSDDDFKLVASTLFAELETIIGGHFAAWARQSRGMTQDAAEQWARDIIPVLLALGQGLILQRSTLPDFDRERYLAAVDALFA